MENEKTWKRSSYCNGGGCPEVAHHGGRVEIRDSERQNEVTWFTEANWQKFVAGVKAGEFDKPEAAR
jgi:hypothetical protein